MSHIRIAPPALLLMGALVVAGCSHREAETPPTAEAATAAFPARVTDRLAEAADRSSQAARTLAMIERTRTEPLPPPANPDLFAPELRQAVTMGWVGPAPEAVRSLARLVGYRFVESGARPSVPTMVVVDATEAPVGDVLADIGLQVRGIGAVNVNARLRTIEYRHGRTLPAQRVVVRAEAHPAGAGGGSR